MHKAAEIGNFTKDYLSGRSESELAWEVPLIFRQVISRVFFRLNRNKINEKQPLG